MFPTYRDEKDEEREEAPESGAEKQSSGEGADSSVAVLRLLEQFKIQTRSQEEADARREATSTGAPAVEGQTDGVDEPVRSTQSPFAETAGDELGGSSGGADTASDDERRRRPKEEARPNTQPDESAAVEVPLQSSLGFESGGSDLGVAGLDTTLAAPPEDDEGATAVEEGSELQAPSLRRRHRASGGDETPSTKADDDATPQKKPTSEAVKRAEGNRQEKAPSVEDSTGAATTAGTAVAVLPQMHYTGSPSPAGLTPFPSWSLLSLGNSVIYSHSHGGSHVRK